MKRSRFLALALVVAVMLMGAGYAAWSDQVFLTTTVNTGNFKMEIDKGTSSTVRTGSRQADNLVHRWHHFDWTSGTRANDVSFVGDDTMVVQLSDLYPGGVVQVDMKVNNMGTIPAKLGSINVEYLEGDYNLFTKLVAKSTWKADVTGDRLQDKWSHGSNQWASLQDAMNNLVTDTNTKNLVIEPNGWFSLGLGEEQEEDGCIQFKLLEDADNYYQDKTVKFKITFNWEQWTTNPNANPYTNYGGDGDLQ